MDKTRSIQPVLAEGGRTRWSIILGGSPHPAERYAAEELARFLGEITGAVFPIADDGGPADGGLILVGQSPLSEPGEIAARRQRMGDDGFMLAARDGRILIAGGSPRGTLYGVYAFLERYLDCRWFAPGVSRIPRRDRVEIPEMEEEHAPAFEYREAYLYDGMDADWAARNRLNGASYALEERHGGGIRYASFVHTFHEIASPDAYFEEHPEYFSLVDGKRLRRNTQLCLTNPDVLALAVRKVRSWLTEHPEAAIVSVSQNDCYNPCQCENCRRIDEYEGSHSGTLIRFVNAVAEAISDEFPHVWVDTLAYQYTRKAPRHVRPHPRVIVRLCSIECCFSHPLETCRAVSWPFREMTPPGQSFSDDLRDWARICDRIYIWDYVTNFAHYLEPFPNLRVLGPNLRFFAAHRVRGVFEQGNYQSPGGDLAPLKAYVLSRLLWDPGLHVRALMEEFAEGYYGRAAGPLLRYIDLLHDASERMDTHLGIYDPPAHAYLTGELLDRAQALLDEAEEAAEGPETLRRVRTARLPLQYARLYRTEPGDSGYARRAEAFLGALEEAGVTFVSEYYRTDEARELMGRGLTPAQIEARRIAQLQAEMGASKE